MSLCGPKKQPDGTYLLRLEPTRLAPTLRWENGVWTPTADWVAWADRVRAELLGQLLNKPAWFSRPPRRDNLDTLFTPWAGQSMTGGLYISARKVPTEAASGSASWKLIGLSMSAQSIAPIWDLTDIIPDADDSDKISLFGPDEEDGEVAVAAGVGAATGVASAVGTTTGEVAGVAAVAADTDYEDDAAADGQTVDGDVREIHLDDIAPASAAASATPTHIRSREWEARKFLSKERVREARLKAQIADRVARKEEDRFYAQFGELDDAESHFSEYDLTDDESDGASAAE